MSLWQKILRVASGFEEGVDHWKQWLTRGLGAQGEVMIQPYIGYGTPSVMRLRGRVLEGHQVRRAQMHDSILDNLRNFYHRFRTDELPHARLSARFGSYEQQVEADEEGYFFVEFQLPEPLQGTDVWQDVLLAYDDGERRAQATGRVLLASPQQAQFGVISDLDDTVLRSEVINWFKLARNTFLKNAHTRMTFRGVAEFYRALQEGTTAESHNPIYYVSNSPYNLYDMIEHFLEVRGIPLGPIFLRDMGLTEHYFLASKQHKITQIERLLRFHEDLPFILIGDSGEQDARIYLNVVERFPGRIQAIYIRDVEPHRFQTRRDRRVEKHAEHARELDCELLLIPDTATAARHAAQQGYIRTAHLPTIEAAQQRGEA